MDNTAYVPPGSLSVFSNNSPNAGTVTPLQEAIMSRMRPFGLTASDLKDLPPSPFLPGGLGLVRPEGFPNFQLPSPFLHPALESWHVSCRKCWLRKLARKEGCGQFGRESQAADLRRVFL